MPRVRKQPKDWTLAEVEAEVRRLDPKLDPSDASFKAAVLLIASLIVGPARAGAFTGYPPELYLPMEERLRANRIWQGDKVQAAWFEREGGIAFWMDVCVAQGLMARTR